MAAIVVCEEERETERERRRTTSLRHLTRLTFLRAVNRNQERQRQLQLQQLRHILSDLTNYNFKATKSIWGELKAKTWAWL